MSSRGFSRWFLLWSTSLTVTPTPTPTASRCPPVNSRNQQWTAPGSTWSTGANGRRLRGRQTSHPFHRPARLPEGLPGAAPAAAADAAGGDEECCDAAGGETKKMLTRCCCCCSRRSSPASFSCEWPRENWWTCANSWSVLDSTLTTWLPMTDPFAASYRSQSRPVRRRWAAVEIPAWLNQSAEGHGEQVVRWGWRWR